MLNVNTQSAAISYDSEKRSPLPRRRLGVFLYLCLSLCVWAGLFHVPAAAGEWGTFYDISEDAWYTGNVQKAWEHGLMVGTDDCHFSPQTQLTRGMFVTVLGRILDAPAEAPAEDPFLDVPADAWYAPYVTWAEENGITYGVGNGNFAPEVSVTREDMATMVARCVENLSLTLPEIESPIEGFGDADTVSDYATDALDLMRRTGIIYGDDTGNFNPKNNATRAEAAAVFVRLYEALYGTETGIINTWVPFSLPEVNHALIANEDIITAADESGLDYGSDAVRALVRINTEYADDLSDADRTKPIVFFFDGVGADLRTDARLDAMVVVVKSGEIAYLNRYSSTIPDAPFSPYWNAGRAMPTIQSGIYPYTTCNHNGHVIRGAALSLGTVPVVRFSSPTSFYGSTTNAIHIHRRNSLSLAGNGNSLANSAGCLLVGKPGSASTDDYAQFAYAVGILPAGASGAASYTSYVTGKLVVDRAFAGPYLKSIGYTDEAIAALG